jgi:hypothetical protein
MSEYARERTVTVPKGCEVEPTGPHRRAVAPKEFAQESERLADSFQDDIVPRELGIPNAYMRREIVASRELRLR